MLDMGFMHRTNPGLSRTQIEFSRTILGATPSSCVSLPKFVPARSSFYYFFIPFCPSLSISGV